MILLRKSGWEQKIQKEKEKKKEWPVRKPVLQQQDALSCKIAVEYFPEERVKNCQLKKKQLGGTLSWPFEQVRLASSAHPFHNFLHLPAEIWNFTYRYTFLNPQIYRTLISECDFNLRKSAWSQSQQVWFSVKPIISKSHIARIV